MKTYFFVLDEGAVRQENRYVNQVVVNDDGRPTRDRYLFPNRDSKGEPIDPSSEWFGSTRTREWFNEATQTYRQLRCKGQVKKFLSLTEWPPE